MATKIQVRRDTAADWTSNNPTLAAGEIGFESDTNKFKIGDGATAWTSLNYAPEGYATTSYVDTQDANIASDTLTFTNKTFDANGTGNSISNIETADIAAGTLVTAAEGIGSNDNDTTIPTSAAVKAYADSVGGGGASLGDLTAVGSTLSSPSNGTLALETSGTGKVVLAANNGDYESGLSSTRYNNSNNLFYEDTSETLDTGTQRYLNNMYGRVTLTSGQATSTNSNDRWLNQNLVRLDMNGNSSTNSSSTYRSRGPSALKNYTTVVNGGAGASTLGNATANLNGIYSYLNNQDLTITAATGVNSTLEFESDGTGDLNVTEWRAYQSFAEGYGSSGSLNITDFYHYYCDTPSGNITNQYAFYDATNSLSVFGDIQTQAVSITDNKITTNRSNDDLLIGTNGTGRINISSDDSYFWGTNALYSNYFGTPNSIKTLGVSKTQTVDANAVSSQQNLVGFAQNTTLSGSSTSNSNFRFRTLNMANSMDMAGYSFTQASDSRGPWAASMVTNVCNSGLTASTLYAALGSQGVAAAYAETDFSNGDLTITHAIANQGYLELESAGSGAGSFTFTNGYNFRSKTYVNSGDTITNHYGFYHQAPTGGGTVTNQYAFYDASNSLSVFGDIQTQAVSITDNVISTNRSNDDLNIKTAGTGRINLSSAGNNQNDSTIWPDFWGSATNVKDFSVHRETSDDANTAARQYLASFANISTLTGGSTSNSNFRPRGVLQSAMVDMAGYSYTLSGDSRGPIGVTCIANAVNSSATASTLASMIGMDNAAGVYAYSSSLAAGNITVTDAKATKNSVYASNDGGGGAGVMTVTNGYGTWNRASVSGASDSITNMYGFYYHGKDGSGSITNEYAFYDASNSLSVFGDIQTQGVSITDNHIKSNRSNDNLNFETNGTGRFNFGDSQTFNVDWQSLYGADNRVTDLAFIKEESKDANTSGFEYMAGFHHDVQLTNGSTTNSNFRPRGILSLTTVDHAGYSYTRSGLFRGPLGAAFGALSMNSSATAATMANNRGLEIAHGAYTFNSATAQGDVTVTDSTGCMAISYAANDDTGTGADFNITNAYAFRAGYYVIGAASSITNHYGYYYHGDEYVGGTNPTNIYAFYDNANKLSRFGAVILANQASDPSGVADSAHIYAKDDAGSSEVYVRDEAGNVTKISPHNEAGEWEYYSRNSKTGKTVRINMEKLVAEVEKLSGKTFIENE